MLKTLLKKQMMELASLYTRDRKTGKSRSKKGAIGFLILYAVLFLFLGFSFFMMSTLIAETLIELDLTWLYFALMSILAVFFGVFGGVFNTYAGLYHAKDNELLLAMPIPPSKILFARMVSVYLQGFLYEAIVFIPAVVAYFIFGHPGVLAVINSILLIFILGFFVLTLTCALGWVVALISSKLKNKSFITVIIALAFFGVYYYACFNYYSAVEKLLADIDRVGVSIKNAAYPLYLLGRGAEGRPVPMLVFTLIVAALFALTYFILSKTFVRITTRKETEAKKVYKEQPVKAKKVESALLRREWKHYASSPTYILNGSLGTVFMPLIGIALLVLRPRFAPMLALLSEMSMPEEILPIALLTMTCMISSMNCLTAPSVSLEGKTLWVVQSLPVAGGKVLEAKRRLHEYLTIPPVVILTVCGGIALGLEFVEIVSVTLACVLFVMLTASVGLWLNLKKPNLSWTSESAVVKQGLPVTVCLFGGWVASIALGGLGYLVTRKADLTSYLLVVIVLLSFGTRYLNRWLDNRGAEILETL